jgi:ABC-2 type transport system permease protein
VSARQSVRAFPALLRIGLLESLAYRGEMLVWILTTTMPLIMLALFTAVAREHPLGRYGAPQLAAYFLVTFIVRQLTSSWSAWQINMEVRDGTMSTRLLRPVHPLMAYAAESLASIPLRAAVALPVSVVLLLAVGAGQLTADPVLWVLWVVSLLGALAISVFVGFAIGALAFFVESATKVLDVWLTVYFVLSGYLIPIELFPARVRVALDWLPFRYQVGLPVELITGAHGRLDALSLVGRQWVFVGLSAVLTFALWRRGLARYAAFGG